MLHFIAAIAVVIGIGKFIYWVEIRNPLQSRWGEFVVNFVAGIIGLLLLGVVLRY